MTKKGYILLETVITLVCLIILIIPILKSVNLIAKDKEQLRKNREVLKIMETVSEDIEFSKNSNEVVQNKQIGEYTVVVKIVETYDNNLYKFDIKVKKDEEEKVQFFMMKRY